MGADGARRITLQLLGGFRLLVDGEAPALGPACQRLVALLGLNGGMARSRAAGTLCPLVPEERALGRLRTCIWRVNGAVPGLIVTTRAAVELDPGIVVDVRKPAAVASTAPYAGDLLPDWDDEWLIVERERRRQIQLHQLEAAAESFAHEGLFGQALAAAYAALGGDPCRESALRIILDLHAAEGNESERDRARLRLASLSEAEPGDVAGGRRPVTGGRVGERSRATVHAAPRQVAVPRHRPPVTQR